MNILFIAAEATPLVKIGGLADVVGSMPKALKQFGHDIRILLPNYNVLHIHSDVNMEKTSEIDDFIINVSGNAEKFSLYIVEQYSDLKYYLLNNTMLSNSDNIYDSNELKRFLLFSKGAVELLHQLDWQPDIIHCHDWHTALIPMWLRESKWKGVTIFTIHNLAYQGFFDREFLAKNNLERYWKYKHHCFSELPLNFLCQGIMHADVLTTVSENYASEILQSEYGMGLDCLLRDRQKSFYGIINGIDYEVYNPEIDQHLAATFSISNLEGRSINKAALQEIVGLPVDLNIPVIGMVSRLDEQKGFDLVVAGLSSLIDRNNIQVIVLGRGQEYYRNMMKELTHKYPKNLVTWTDFDEPLARLIYGGCDIFLMPSRFEPCGLGQLIAMRYGAIPVVRHTGGLVDTVIDLSPDLSNGTGFVFTDYSVEAMVNAIKRAINTYAEKRHWRSVIQRIMSQDFSWQNSARKYEDMYKLATEHKKNG